jgi:hypothetical protein
MRLKREYKIGISIQFKWYNRWQDEYENPNNFEIKEGVVDSNTFFNNVIVFNRKENKYYSVQTENIVKEF